MMDEQLTEFAWKDLLADHPEAAYRCCGAVKPKHGLHCIWSSLDVLFSRELEE